MTRSLLLVSLAAGSLTAPVPARWPAPAPVPAAVPPAATEPAIRAITVRPADPVVGAHDSVRLVIDVIAKGAQGKNGVTVKVEPGIPPAPPLSTKPPVADTPAPAATPTPTENAQPEEPNTGTRPLLDPQPDPVRAEPPDPFRAEPPDPFRAEPPDPFRAEPADPKEGVPPEGKPPAVPPILVWRVGLPPVARMADGWETWRFLPDKRLNRFYPTGTWTVTATARGQGGATVSEYASFQFKRATKLASVSAEKAARPSGGVRLRGTLTRIDPRGLTDYGPFAKQPVEILWRPDTATTWEQAGETKTDDAGAFVTTIPAHVGGHWRVRYPGTDHYAPDQSKSRQTTQ
ncbi:hypothetical protein ACFLIM_08890 [Nonomuraea sp. M3C6]|uniref:Uncharacterized protein n=1 Tax=Nonomuraea marmarensis TaxID=3351344 RepID=A0ABW7AAF3_9ACTN